MVQEGQRTFRFDTFGDEAFWGDQLKLHLAIEGAQFGGVGPGVSPRTALSVGLKVDADALPLNLLEQFRRGDINLDNPAVTLALLRLDAVVGLKGFFEGGTLRSIGIQCALCHSTVDNSQQGLCPPGLQPNPGTGCVGRRLDGWPNRDLNVGAIIALAPDLTPFTNLLGVDADTVRKVLLAWGPGKFDAELILDGKGFRPDGQTAATLIPPAFGLAGVNLHTWTGWGSIPYWNAFVANLEMHGQGRFFDPRLDNPQQFPIAAANGFANVMVDPDADRITAKLPALHLYQLSIPSPEPPADSFDREAARRGEALFTGKAMCNNCHVKPLWTEPGWNLHLPSEICTDSFQADRSPDRRYRTSPLGALFTHTKGGFYHDGRFATLPDVIDHYNACFSLGLTEAERNDLVNYLLSLRF
ncbi:MAG: hypothetical protein IRZ15_06615 [Bryobacteraceae bacterium]|nr:hypothetical protein [Bryobacteraceae bacterium]